MSDLSKYCVLIGERSSKRRFPISNYVVCVQSCDGSRGGYIIRFSHFVFCITGNQPSKSLTCGYSISVPDTLPHRTYTLLISAPAVIPEQKSDSSLANPL